MREQAVRGLEAGAAALTSVLFFDEINRDSKGFVSADGVIIVGGFFNRCTRSFNLLTIPPPAFSCHKNVPICVNNFLKTKLTIYVGLSGEGPSIFVIIV